MRTESALQEMNKAVDILREEITAEAKVDITKLNKADTTDSDKAYPISNRYRQHTSNKNLIVALSSI